MASNPKFCSICDQRHITKPSTDWCFECNQALCTECKDFHTISKASKNHSSVAISNYLALDSSFSQIEGHCSVHDDKYQLFCQSHDCLLCLTCLEEHMKCEGVVRISKLTEDVKTSETFIETQNSLSDIILNLSKIQSNLEENLRDITTQKESVLRQITQLRKKINSHFDQLENALKIELCKLVDDQCHTNIDTTLEEIRKQKVNMEIFQQEMEDLYKYGSDLQTFFGLRRISVEMNTTDQYLQTLGDDGILNRVEVSCKMDTKICNFIEEVNSLGSIQLQKLPDQITLKRSKNKQAQLVGVRNKSINEIKLKLEHTFKLPSRVTGCCFLPDGKIVLCDRSCKNYVRILNPHAELMFEISMSPSQAFDVTCIDDRTVAVSSDSIYCRQINIVNIDAKSRRPLLTEGICYGITHKDGSLMVCVERKGIQNVNTQNGKSTSIVPCKLSIWCYIVSSDNKLYYTNSEDHSIKCCDMEGNIIWTFKNENVVRDPCGIAVDNTGTCLYCYSTYTNCLVCRWTTK
ncbi:unnamed protein product [Mytilus coruscus]|uniref:B box-type domain-containing protein n=1 Tax=Mytilus coruscus TaxID=42192 RepID=A0A6J8BAL9_MYTCO|nr:unnamed protein product [Mytilus coruscus]